MPLSRIEIRRLAAVGAQVRLREIEAERAAILSAFPQSITKTESSDNNAPIPHRRRRRMSAEARRKISEAAKRRWAAHRKAKGKS